jgi:hypothetical protein
VTLEVSLDSCSVLTTCIHVLEDSHISENEV